MERTESQPDNRERQRLATAVDIRLVVLGDDQSVPCESVDLSLGGARVRSPLGLEPEATVVVVISTDERSVVTLGTVKSSVVLADLGLSEIGLQFVHVSEGRREGLARILESIRPRT